MVYICKLGARRSSMIGGSSWLVSPARPAESRSASIAAGGAGRHDGTGKNFRRGSSLQLKSCGRTSVLWHPEPDFAYATEGATVIWTLQEHTVPHDADQHARYLLPARQLDTD